MKGKMTNKQKVLAYVKNNPGQGFKEIGRGLTKKGNSLFNAGPSLSMLTADGLLSRTVGDDHCYIYYAKEMSIPEKIVVLQQGANVGTEDAVLNLDTTEGAEVFPLTVNLLEENKQLLVKITNTEDKIKKGEEVLKELEKQVAILSLILSNKKALQALQEKEESLSEAIAEQSKRLFSLKEGMPKLSV